MGFNTTPSGERVHIGFFGKRNVGKSSLVNAVTGQELSVVSSVMGTTTDPVTKAMELLPLGPVMIIDTPGIDDEGSLGEQRVKRTRQVLNKTDIAVLVADAALGLQPIDRDLISLFQEKKLHYLIVYNKADLLKSQPDPMEHELYVSALSKTGIDALKERLSVLMPTDEGKTPLVADLLRPGELAVLVVPLDKAAPKGRLILPQQQVIRDVLEAGAAAVVTRDTELRETLKKLGVPPAMVITDSQAFHSAAADTPEDVPLTSFSILMARYKGFLETAVRGITAVGSLKDGDRILISEGCTHHRQCDDIGTVKLPNWLRKYTKAQISIETSSGAGFPEDLTPYRLVLHCGGCMLGDREVQYRMHCAQDQNVPFTNYGVAIAYMQGILYRSLSLFPELQQLMCGKETEQ